VVTLVVLVAQVEVSGEPHTQLVAMELVALDTLQYPQLQILVMVVMDQVHQEHLESLSFATDYIKGKQWQQLIKY